MYVSTCAKRMRKGWSGSMVGAIVRARAHGSDVSEFLQRDSMRFVDGMSKFTGGFLGSTDPT